MLAPVPHRPCPPAHRPLAAFHGCRLRAHGGSISRTKPYARERCPISAPGRVEGCGCARLRPGLPGGAASSADVVPLLARKTTALPSSCCQFVWPLMLSSTGQRSFCTVVCLPGPPGRIVRGRDRRSVSSGTSSLTSLTSENLTRLARPPCAGAEGRSSETGGPASVSID